MQLKLNKFFLSSLLNFSLLISISISTANTNPDSATLLAFKLSSDPSNSLPWPDLGSDSDPCSWLGVTCHPSTHRVTKLVLNHLNLTGSTQTLTRLTQLRHLSLHHNRLSSAPSLSSWPNLKHLYLSHNRFSGQFPAGVSHLHRLLRLDFSYNHFSGEIPLTELTQLPQLLTLRLEFNSFTGTLNSTPTSSSLLEFDVSGNDLAGKIPDSLSKFPVTSFAGNFRLCGKPLSANCYNRTMHSKPSAGGDSTQIRVDDEKIKKKVRDSVELMIIGVDVLAVIATLMIVTWCCYGRKYKYGGNKEKVGGYSKINGGMLKESRSGGSDEERMVCFEGCKGFDKVEELLTASAEMLGKGSVGTTYKVVTDGGDVLVVKRVRVRGRRNIKTKEIDGFLRKNIGGLRNPNILSLRAFSCSKDELLLVYDFLPNGSLYTLLHGNRGPGRTPLDWTTRLKLASGAAQGLAFLHSQENSKLSHGNLTSSNIIIDNLGNACISDIALNLLLQIPFSPNNAYGAPELTQLNNTANNNNFHTRNYSKKCDVHSFGIILLEILTGKTANVEGEGSLASWVRRVMVQEEWSWELFDFELLRYKEMQGEMVALLQVALLCLALSPSDRPEMSVVHKMVDHIRVKGCGEGEGQELNELSSGSCSLSESTSLNFTSN